MEKPGMSKISRPAGLLRVLHEMIDETNELRAQNVDTTLQSIEDERAAKKAEAKAKAKAKAKAESEAKEKADAEAKAEAEAKAKAKAAKKKKARKGAQL